MSERIPLPAHLRDVFEVFGVVKPPAMPRLDQLEHVMRARKMSSKLTIGEDGMTAAWVTAKGQTFAATADHPAVAVAEALAQALKASVPVQLALVREEAGTNAASDRPAATEDAPAPEADHSDQDDVLAPPPAGDPSFRGLVVRALQEAGEDIHYDPKAGKFWEQSTGQELDWDFVLARYRIAIDKQQSDDAQP